MTLDHHILDASVAKALTQATDLIAFAGAGISVDPPTNAPLWRDVERTVIDSIVSRLCDEDWPVKEELPLYCLAILQRLRPETFLQAIRDRCPYVDYRTLLRLLIADQFNSNHAALVSLLLSGRLNAIITTNFDENLELAMVTLSGRPARVCATADDYTSRLAIKPELYKLHGTISSPTSLAATLSRTALLPRKKAETLASLVGACPVLFVGYSGNDDDIWPVLADNLATSTQPVFVCIHPASVADEPVRHLPIRNPHVFEAPLSSVWNALGWRKEASTGDRYAPDGEAKEQLSPQEQIQTLVSSLPVWQLCLLLGNLALACGDNNSANWFGELAGDVMDTRRYAYSTRERAVGKLGAQTLEVSAQANLGYVMSPTFLYWTGQYGDERLDFGPLVLKRLLAPSERRTLLLTWARSDVYQGEFDRAHLHLEEAAAIVPESAFSRVEEGWITGALSLRKGDYTKAVDDFATVLELSDENNDPLTYSRICGDAALVSFYDGRCDKACSLAQAALKVCGRTKDAFLLTRLYSILLMCEKLKGDTSELLGFWT